jgi:DNA repair protein REV1
LKGFNFDPRDLRGIGIQIQKLEKPNGLAGGSADPAQTKLNFGKRSKEENPKVRKVDVDVEGSGITMTVQLPSSQSQSQTNSNSHPPSSQSQPKANTEIQESTDISSVNADTNPHPLPNPHSTQAPSPGTASNLHLPSFSQVDREAFEALPTQLRSEIKQEYSRRSASPALSALADTRPPSLSPQKKRTTDKGTPLSRIAQALAPRTKDGGARSTAILGGGANGRTGGDDETGMEGLQRGNLFERCAGQRELRGSKVVVTRAELERLGIDARVFYELPKEMQMEQLASARFEKSFGAKRKRKK